MTIIQHNSILRPEAASSQTYSSGPGSDTIQQNKRHSALEVIFALIRSASDEDAQGIVSQIKLNRNLEDIAASITKPKHIVGNKPRNTNASRKNQSVLQKAHGREGRGMSRKRGESTKHISSFNS
jgi:hypothetical protein